VIFFLFLLALLVFHLRMGITLLNPTQIDWLWQADWATHYLGWLFYRNEGWTFPPGIIQNYLFPEGSSIGLTDSIPLAAFFFKILRGLLPENFQFLTLWFCMSLFLQGYFAQKLLRLFRPSVEGWKIALASAFFVMAPPLMWRNWHIALCSHWLLLWGIYIYCRAVRRKEFSNIEFLFLAMIAATIHPYLMAMTLSIAVASAALKASWADNFTKKLQAFFVLVLSYVGVTFFFLWLCGYFLSAGEVSYSGFGYYTFDLLGFFHPHDLPVIMPNIPRATGQYEGYAYLGLGVLIFIGVNLFHLRKRWRTTSVKDYRFLIFAGVAGLVFALSNQVHFAGQPILDLSWFYKFLGNLPHQFRSSGRFVWPLYYMILVWCFVSFFDLRSRKWSIFFVVISSLHFVDINRIVIYPRSVDIEFPREELNSLILPTLQSVQLTDLILVDHSKVKDCFLAPIEFSRDPLYYPLLEFGAKHKLRVNYGVASRHNKPLEQRLCVSLINDLEAATLKPKTLYVFRKPVSKAFNLALEKLSCFENTVATACSTVGQQ